MGAVGIRPVPFAGPACEKVGAKRPDGTIWLSDDQGLRRVASKSGKKYKQTLPNETSFPSPAKRFVELDHGQHLAEPDLR